MATWCGGCFYIEPAWKPGDNQAPFIQYPPPEARVITLSQPLNFATVTATDADDDPVYFQWIGLDSPSTTDLSEERGGVVYYTTVLRLPYDPDLDGLDIVTLVTDGREPVYVRWVVEVE